MNSLVPIALYGWFVVVFGLFIVLRPRRAAIASYLGAILFLPQAELTLEGLPEITKITITSFAVLFAIAVFDVGRLLRFRPSMVDTPIAIWCVVPMASSITNGLGVYDGLASVIEHVAVWGLPYLVGRLYLNSVPALRDLAIAIVIGGLLYVPLCWLEIRLSPQLHRWVYSYHQHSFLQTYRWGGYRPTVFMEHGLMVGFWMISATLAAAWLWSSGAKQKLLGVPMWACAGVLLMTSIACKSTGAALLMILGFGVLWSTRHVRASAIVLVLLLLPPFYLWLRTSGVWHGDQLTQLVAKVSPDRARSMGGRFHQERMLLDKAHRRALLGWGQWNRWRIQDERGHDVTIADSLWIISLGRTGFIGLIAVVAAILLPAGLLLARISASRWLEPSTGPPAVLAVLLVLFMFDGLLNAMLNPMFVLAAGGLSGFFIVEPRLRRVAEQLRQRTESADSEGMGESRGQVALGS
jgi:hypothetical protein